MERTALIGHGGVPRDAILAGLRLVIHGRYNIYFRVTDTDTIILRVLHGARDMRRIRFED
jgi:plasmid stabilization system protein ParE